MNFIKKSTLLVLIIGFFNGATCKKENEDCHKRITFTNKSNSSIYIRLSRSYPDTLSYRNGPNPKLQPQFFNIASNATNTTALESRSCIESEFGTPLIPNNILMVYVFNAEALDTLPDNTIIYDYLILKRYDLTLQNLKDRNWAITYP